MRDVGHADHMFTAGGARTFAANFDHL